MVDKLSAEQFHPAGVAELDLYQRREKIYTRKIQGFYQRIRVYTGWPLLLGYFLLPWLNWNEQQAVLFDIPSRQFHVFTFTFWPQDFYLLSAILIFSAFTLFAVTAWLGRVWCGYTCPQTIWTAIFMWSEQLCEGSRNQRIRRDRAAWNFNKFTRKISKHGLWLSFSLLTGLTFVGYFSPVRELSISFLYVFIGQWQLSFWEIAWTIFFTGATYINAGWLREQVCIYMCPYARFQSVMFDKDTLIVSYNVSRGEQRGARKKGSDYKTQGLGECVDCRICVQVCPAGIDIREGLQYECINCALCIDGCNSVMEQMGYKKGLISYTTESALNGVSSGFFRLRLIGYFTAALLMASLLLIGLINRVPLELDVIRDRNRLYLEATNGLIENNYTLKIINMSQYSHHYKITVAGLSNLEIVGADSVSVAAGSVSELPLRLRLDPINIPGINNTIIFTAQSEGDQSLQATASSRFIGPSI